MIEKDKFHIFNYIKKEEYCASMDGMRYMLKKHKKKVQEEDNEEKKQRMEFDFSTDGVMDAADWLNEQYMQQKPLWDLSKKLV